MRYFPPEPVLKILERHGGLHVGLRPLCESRKEYDKVSQSIRRGRITHPVADIIATRLYMHPSLIWGDLWWTGGLKLAELETYKKEKAAA